MHVSISLYNFLFSSWERGATKLPFPLLHQYNLENRIRKASLLLFKQLKIDEE